MENYYVVKKGHKTGIFKTWDECKAATSGYSNPIFRKFNSFNEAQEFFKTNYSKTINSSNNKKSNNKPSTSQPSNNINLEKINNMVKAIKHSPYSENLNYNVEAWNSINNEIYIFTDGSSRKTNIQPNSGTGVYLGHQCINIKEQYNDRTNNMCELQGLDYAFKLIVKYAYELSKMKKIIKIVSDSEYCIKACSIWLPNWKKNNWKTSTGEDVKNRDLIESIDSYMSRIKLLNSKLPDEEKIKIKLIHINSHQQMPDINDKIAFSLWFGNHVADCLASGIV